MAIPEELRETVFSYCKEEDTPDTLGPMTVAWDGAEGVTPFQLWEVE